MLDIKKVNAEEFFNKFDEALYNKNSYIKDCYTFFLFGENSGVIRDDSIGTVEFINVPTYDLNTDDEMELLVNICGNPGEFRNTDKIPSLKTIADYEEDAHYIHKMSLYIWITQICFITIPIALAIWIISLLINISQK